MSIHLGQEFDPDWRGKPPGMSKRDRELWSRFLDIYSPLFIKVFYNCKVGLLQENTPAKGPEGCKEWLPYTMPRIDALVETDHTLVSIEVRPEAGRAALGAALTYRYILEQDPPSSKVIIGAVLTNRMTRMYREIYSAFNIFAFVV